MSLKKKQEGSKREGIAREGLEKEWQEEMGHKKDEQSWGGKLLSWRDLRR